MTKIDQASAPRAQGSRYPAPFGAPCKARHWLRLGDAAGLTQFGVNLLILPPGTWSSQRHWHSHEDEFVFVLSGEVVLVTDAFDGTTRLARHRQVNALLLPEFGLGLHALAIHAYTEGEWRARHGQAPLSPPCAGGGRGGER